MFTEKQISFARQHAIHAFVVKYLEDLGFDDEQKMLSHLYPKLSDLPDPFDMKNMRKIASLTAEYIVNSKDVIIWGDYDVDGITGSSVLYNFIRDVNGCPYAFIPNRLTDGYGLNKLQLQRLSKKHSPEETLIITVDCGISNKEEVAYAKELGFTVIVTDHHSIIANKQPDCLILNGKQKGCSFKEHQLAGVGTAFFLIVAIRTILNKAGWFSGVNKLPNLKKYLDLVAIGTVADLVPLSIVNRILVKAGFEVMVEGKYSSPGLGILLNEIDLEKGPTTSEEIAFKISPLLNSSGRMGRPQLAFDLLTHQDKVHCTTSAQKLLNLNKKRKKICKNDLEHALSITSNNLIIEEKITIIFGPFHNGVIGITASKLTEQFNVPAIVFSEDTDEHGVAILKGSCRSVSGIDILKVLHFCKDLTIAYGGHQGAAGVTIFKKDFERFKGKAIGVMQNKLAKCREDHFSKQYNLPLDIVFQPLFLKSFEMLEPMGQMMPKPSFFQENVSLVQSKLIGVNQEHLQLVFRGKQQNFRGVGFYLGKQFAQSSSGKTYRIEYTPYLNKFNRQESWQVLVSSIVPE